MSRVLILQLLVEGHPGAPPRAQQSRFIFKNPMGGGCFDFEIAHSKKVKYFRALGKQPQRIVFCQRLYGSYEK